MMFSEYKKWVAANCPPDTDEEGFTDYLAMIGATIISEASKNTGQSVERLIAFHFSDKDFLTDA